MPSIKVYNASTWKVPVAISVYNVGIGWKPAKRIWRAANGHIDPSTLVWVNDWILIANYTFPTTQTPAPVTIAKTPTSITTYGAQVSWNVITDPSDDRYGWDVVAFFHNNTTGDTDIYQVPQANGFQRSKAWAFGDNVNADVFYSFNSHDGTHVVTGSVILGP